MKILNVSEAAVIIGGAKQSCTNSYEKIIIGGKSSCNLVTTCTDKYGNKTYKVKPSDTGNCFIPTKA